MLDVNSFVPITKYDLILDEVEVSVVKPNIQTCFQYSITLAR